MLSEFISTTNELLRGALVNILPEAWWSSLLLQYPFVILSVFLAFFVVLLIGAILFFDFIKDAWKIPFGIGVDACKYLGLIIPGFALGSALAGAVIFIFISNAGPMKWFFAIISVASGLGAFFLGGAWGVLIALLPLNSIMMLISTIID